jgi:ribose-phosphate pyrophosphokinase
MDNLLIRGCFTENCERAVIIAAPDSLYFAQRISQLTRIPILDVERKIFAGGERYYRLDVESRTDLVGRDVLYIGTTHSDVAILDLYRIGSTLAELGTARRIFLVPFFGYSTMERDVKPGECVTAKTAARMFSHIPATSGNTFIFCDLHCASLRRYFDGPVTLELYAERVLLNGIREHLHTVLGADETEYPQKLIFASADLGRPIWVESFARHFGTSIALVSKARDGEKTVVRDVIGDVRGKVVAIYDDMTRSAGTIVHAADAYMSRGAVSVVAIITHLALNGPEVVQMLEESVLTKVISTDTHPSSQLPAVLASPKFEIRTVTGLYANALRQGILSAPAHAAPHASHAQAMSPGSIF